MRANYLTLRRPRERFHWCSEKRNRQGRIEAFSVFYFPSFVFCFRFIFEQTETFYIIKENLLCVGEKPSIVSRGALFVLFLFLSFVSLFLCACVHLERENVCCSWYSSRFNLGFRVSLILSLSVLFLFVNVWSLKDREREN